MKAVRNGCPDVSLSDGVENGERLHPKLGWTLYELAQTLGVSVPFLRLEVKRGKLHAARLGRRVVLLDAEVCRYLAEASGLQMEWEACRSFSLSSTSRLPELLEAAGLWSGSELTDESVKPQDHFRDARTGAGLWYRFNDVWLTFVTRVAKNRAVAGEIIRQLAEHISQPMLAC